MDVHVHGAPLPAVSTGLNTLKELSPIYKLRKICLTILTPAPHQSLATSSRHTCGSLYNNAVVCTSMMIGCATAVYVRASCKFTIIQKSVGSAIREMNTLQKKLFSSFWSQSVKYCPRENVNVQVMHVHCYWCVL